MPKQKSSGKHYTVLEKKILVEILKKYSEIIETKKSDSSSLKDKDAAWKKIAEEYNLSRDIMEERSVQQLRKLWANMKAGQRNILTKERQARLATGGGPEEKTYEIDPHIALVAQNLLEMAPIHFSSDMSEAEIREHRQQIRDNPNEMIGSSTLIDNEAIQEEIILSQLDVQTTDLDLHNKSNVIDYIIDLSNEEISKDKSRRSPFSDITNARTKKRLDTSNAQETALKTSTQQSNAIPLTKSAELIPGPSIIQKKSRQQKTCANVAQKSQKSLDVNIAEQQLKIELIRQIMNQEASEAEIELQRKKNSFTHELLIQEITVNHMRRMHELEYRQALLKTELNELQVQKEKTKN